MQRRKLSTILVCTSDLSVSFRMVTACVHLNVAVVDTLEPFWYSFCCNRSDQLPCKLKYINIYTLLMSPVTYTNVTFSEHQPPNAAATCCGFPPCRPSAVHYTCCKHDIAHTWPYTFLHISHSTFKCFNNLENINAKIRNIFLINVIRHITTTVKPLFNELLGD